MKYDITVYNSLIIEDLTAILTGHESRGNPDMLLVLQLKDIIKACQKDVAESEENMTNASPDSEKSIEEVLNEQTPEDRISLDAFIRGISHAR